jgi:sugar phosphate isomerase/epimerase
MKFSMMTYTMARQGKYGVEDIVRTAIELEMDGIDWVTTYGRNPKELQKLCADVGLPVVAYTFPLPAFYRGESNWMDEAKHEVETAVMLGAPLVMIPAPGLARITDRTENRRIWINALAKVMVITQEAGLALSVENTAGKLSPFVIATDFLEAKSQIPLLKLTFDNGNATTGENQIASLRACAGDIIHVHLKDWQRKDEPTEGACEMLDGRYYSPALIGEGIVDSKATLQELEAIGYNGYINIEYENNKYPAEEGIRRVLKYLRP